MYNGWVSTEENKNDDANNLKKFKIELFSYCLQNSNFFISFPPSKIISEKLYCEYFLVLRKIITTQKNDNDNNNKIEQLFQKYLKKDFTIDDDIQYNEETITKFMGSLRDALRQEHNKDHNDIIEHYWYYIILEMMLFQILIPTMNNISNKLTLNYYLYEDGEKVRNLKFMAFMLKDYSETRNKNRLKEQINNEISELYKMVSSVKYSNYNNMTSTPLLTLYKCIIDGKQNWYNSNKFDGNQNYEILIKFEGLPDMSKESSLRLRLYLNLVFFVFIANRIVISPLNPRNEKVNFPYEVNINSAYLSKNVSVLHPITATKYDKEIKELVLKNNFPDIYSMYELAVSCFLNNSICNIDLSRCSIDQHILKGFEIGLKDVEQFQDEKHFVNVSYLNLAHNKLKGETLSNIIELMPQLKTLNLNGNQDCHDGKAGQSQLFAYLFNKLEKLYRKKKCFLQNLYLTKCNLNKDSLHELGKLIKSRNCGIKFLALNSNKLDKELETAFSKKLKFNKSINELYLYEIDFCGKDYSHSLSIIPNTFIRKIYLHKNYISSNTALKLIAQTQVDK